MHVLQYSELRKNLASTMEKVCDDRAPVLVTRQNKRPVVMMSLEDYSGWEETEYLLRSPKNRERLLRSWENIKKGEYKEYKLIEEEGDE